MTTVLTETIRGGISLSLYAFNTLFWCTPLFLVAAAKFLVPAPGWRRRCGKILNGIAENWVGVNNLNQRLATPASWRIEGVAARQRSGWYLVLSNHQS